MTQEILNYRKCSHHYKTRFLDVMSSFARGSGRPSYMHIYPLTHSCTCFFHRFSLPYMLTLISSWAEHSMSCSIMDDPGNLSFCPLKNASSCHKARRESKTDLPQSPDPLYLVINEIHILMLAVGLQGTLKCEV